jgi:acetoin utilization deacetylase AcuC-like enzyme
MQLFYTDVFVLPLPEGHRFPMSKYARLRQAVLDSGVFSPDELALPPAASDAQLAQAHCPDYVARVAAGELTPTEMRQIGFPWSAEMVERSRRSAGATRAT